MKPIKKKQILIIVNRILLILEKGKRLEKLIWAHYFYC